MRDKVTLSTGRERRVRQLPLVKGEDGVERYTRDNEDGVMRWDEREGQRRVANYRGIVQSAGNLGSLVADKVQGTDDWYFDLIAALRRPADVACPTCGDKGTIKGYMREDGRNGVQPRTDVFDRPCPNLGYHHAETGGCAPIPVAAPLPTDASAAGACPTCGHDALAAAREGEK
jgi:predicted RNA-binding Zn-ribbon protein involved in translation (DUF1610 family)